MCIYNKIKFKTLNFLLWNLFFFLYAHITNLSKLINTLLYTTCYINLGITIVLQLFCNYKCITSMLIQHTDCGIVIFSISSNTSIDVDIFDCVCLQNYHVQGILMLKPNICNKQCHNMTTRFDRNVKYSIANWLRLMCRIYICGRYLYTYCKLKSNISD